MPTAAYYTLGCKVNQYETEKIRERLELAGFSTVPFASAADVYIINSCTVTGSADSKSRRAIRQAARCNPEAVVVATGCYAELRPTEIAEIEGVDLVIGNDDKDLIPERLIARFSALPHLGHERAQPRVRTRAVVKVQDGCSQFCAYCAVPYARSREWSRPIPEVIEEISTLAGFGYKEVVLTGIRLGSYCHDLAELVERVSQIEGIERVRLSSIEVWEVDDRLVSVIAANPKVCRHLHIPLQSGDAGVLGLMRRPYSPVEYAAAIERVRGAIPGLGLTTDLIVGFPGETEEAFERSLEFVQKTGFSRLHVFRYSQRSGTAAAGMANQVAEADKTRRSERMIEQGAKLAHDFAQEMVGQTVSVLVERKHTEVLAGLTDNYVEVTFAGPAHLRGEIVPVRTKDVGQSGLSGTISEAEVVI